MEKRLIDANSLKAEIRDFYESEYPTASGEFDKFVTMHLPRIINNSPTIEKWISVAERLPDKELAEFLNANPGEQGVDVVVFIEGAERSTSLMYDGNNFCEPLDMTTTYRVTHWMPLPELPEGGAKE